MDFEGLTELAVGLPIGLLLGWLLLVAAQASRHPVRSTRRPGPTLAVLTTSCDLSTTSRVLTGLADRLGMKALAVSMPTRVVFITRGLPFSATGPGHFVTVRLHPVDNGGTRLDFDVRRRVPGRDPLGPERVARVHAAVSEALAPHDLAVGISRLPDETTPPTSVVRNVLRVVVLALVGVVIGPLLAHAFERAAGLRADEPSPSASVAFDPSAAAWVMLDGEADDRGFVAVGVTTIGTYTAFDSVEAWYDRAGHLHRRSWPACLRHGRYRVAAAVHLDDPGSNLNAIDGIDCRRVRAVGGRK